MHDTAFAGDLVDGDFTREHPDQLWVTDITEHPTREGNVYRVREPPAGRYPAA